jgi:hypothetical protein
VAHQEKTQSFHNVKILECSSFFIAGKIELLSCDGVEKLMLTGQNDTMTCDQYYKPFLGIIYAIGNVFPYDFD